MKQLLLSILFGALASLSFSQDNLGSIRGAIYDAETGEPAIFTNVYILNQDSVAVGGSQTDFDGLFIVTNLKPATYSLLIRDIEHDTTFIQNVVLEPNGIVTKKIHLTKPKLPLIEIHRYKEPLHKLSPADRERLKIKNE